MAKIKLVTLVNITTILGKAVKIQLLGTAKPFHFRVTGSAVFVDGSGEEQTTITGYDAESLDLSINIKDIEYIFGG